jgi:hypothetical protein
VGQYEPAGHRRSWVLEEHRRRRELASTSVLGSAKLNFWHGRFGSQLARTIRKKQTTLYLPPFLAIDSATKFLNIVFPDEDDDLQLGDVELQVQGAFEQQEVDRALSHTLTDHRLRGGAAALFQNIDTSTYANRFFDDQLYSSDQVSDATKAAALRSFIPTSRLDIIGSDSTIAELKTQYKEAIENHNAEKDSLFTQPGDAAQKFSKITFSGGQVMEYEYKSSMHRHHAENWHHAVERVNDAMFSVQATIFGLVGLNAGFQSNNHEIENYVASITHDNQHDTAIKIVLGDEDLGDYVDAQLFEDPYSGMPIVLATSGRTSCPHTMNTVPREQIEVLGEDVKLINLDPREPVVFTVNVVNSSPTDELLPYVIAQNATTNPNGLTIEVFGQTVTEEFIKVYLLPNRPSGLEFTVRRPEMSESKYFDFEGIQIKVMSPCNWHQVKAIITFSLHFRKPCPPIEWSGALARDWTIERRARKDTSLAQTRSGIFIVPEAGLLAAVRNPLHQLAPWNSTLSDQVEAVMIQVRRLGTDAWEDISDDLKNDISIKYGEIRARLAWPNGMPNRDEYSPGVYEVRGIVKCQKKGGKRADSLKYSVTPVRRVVLGRGFDPADVLEAKLDELSARVDELSARMADIATDNDDVICTLDADVAAFNKTVDKLTDGSCKLQKQEQGEEEQKWKQNRQRQRQSSKLQSESGLHEQNRHSIVCEDGKSLSCCGNGIREPGEACDTAVVSSGCVGCQVITGWICKGDLGSVSVCKVLTPRDEVGGFGSDANGDTNPSLELNSTTGAVEFKLEFPSSLLPAGEFIAVSTPTISISDLPAGVRADSVIRLVPSVPPRYHGGSTPIVVSIQLLPVDADADADADADSGSGDGESITCDASFKLRFFDTAKQEWSVAANTCPPASYLSVMDTTTCTLTTHVCHMTDFAAFSQDIWKQQHTTSPRATGLPIAASVFIALASVAFVAFVVVQYHRQSMQHHVNNIVKHQDSKVFDEASDHSESRPGPIDDDEYDVNGSAVFDIELQQVVAGSGPGAAQREVAADDHNTSIHLLPQFGSNSASEVEMADFDMQSQIHADAKMGRE